MGKQLQQKAVILLGAVAVILAGCVVFLYCVRGGSHGLSFAPAGLPSEAGYALVDINEADRDELLALPGIGEVLADRIIDRRADPGPFQSREDILAVPGIGEATLEGFEPYITYHTQDGDS